MDISISRGPYKNGATISNILEFLNESNAIEGEYSSGALEDAIVAWNYAVQNYPIPMTLGYVLDIHARLMKNLKPDIAGRLRDRTVWVGSRECFYVSQELIREELGEWCECNIMPRLHNNKAMEFVCRKSHVSFERIHPFLDGNGRVGRIIMNVMRLDYKLPLLIIHEGSEQL